MKRGVKEYAHSDLVCPHYVKSQFFEKKLDEKKSVHDDMKHIIAKYFKTYGFTCKEEVKLEYRFLKGKVDILCKKDNFYVLIEIKSSYIPTNLNFDSTQLLIYKYMLIKELETKGIKITPQSIKSILIYKNPFYEGKGVLASVKVGDMIINLPKEYLYLLLENSYELEDMINEQKSNDTYVISRECNTCGNSRCFVKNLEDKVYKSQSTQL